MGDYEITFKVDGKIISQEQIREMELSRYHLVFKEMYEHEIVPLFHGIEIPKNAAEKMPLDDLRECLAETRENLGRERIREIYKKDLENGDKMWHEIAQNSVKGKNLQAGLVEVETKGISLEQFMLCNQSIAKNNNLTDASKMHPEHYSFEAGAGGTQIIIETFGMYKYPTYLFLEPSTSTDYPIPLDEDTLFPMFGKTSLMSDKTDTKIIGMHQMKQRKGGMGVKLGVFLPEAAPKEIVEGHKWHLMVEFNNALHEAAKIKVNPVQKAAIGLALKKMGKDNHK